jgi:hypothetical protein
MTHQKFVNARNRVGTRLYRVRDLSTWDHGQSIADAIQSGPYPVTRIFCRFHASILEEFLMCWSQ